MVRITNAVARHRRKKRLLKRAKGFWGDRKNHLKLTKGEVMRAQAYNYAHRKQKKRNFRSLWIVRINAAAKMEGISYSRLVNGLKLAQCEIDRKMLADLAVNDFEAFRAIAQAAKQALSAAA